MGIEYENWTLSSRYSHLKRMNGGVIDEDLSIKQVGDFEFSNC